MAEKTTKVTIHSTEDTQNSEVGTSKSYARDFMVLRNAIIENCRDCIRDCGRDCLNKDAKPIENIRCSLQKVRMDYGIIIEDDVINGSNMWSNRKIGIQHTE
ncbi:MAG: hypothetical protein JSV56_02990 [Methanomassiliicoccales archaeon]|nr:MAG: hypothetical protein JSV56_02990 [Methanomassiliicoccales archaeon]